MKYQKPTLNELIILRSLANFQFEKNIGHKLFPSNIVIFKSPKTKRIRVIKLNDQVLASIRAHDSFLLLTPYGASRIVSDLNGKFIVTASDVAVPFVKKGRNLFAKHVLRADPSIPPKAEVIVVDPTENVIATGTSVLNGYEMVMFKRGTAVKIRHGKPD